MMTIPQKVNRILATRKGTRPGNPSYGSRMYLLRDKRADGEATVWFAKYAHEDIVESDPTIIVLEAKLVSIAGDKVTARIKLADNTIIPVEIQL